MNEATISYAVNGRVQFATVEFDREGSFILDGQFYHKNQLVEAPAWGGGTILVLTEYDYWHTEGPCDVRGCCNN